MRKKISQLRHRLTFQKKTETQDEEGNWNATYVDLFTVWGAVEGAGSLGNSETMIAGALGVKTPKKITVRYRKDIKPNMRIVKRVPKEKTERVFDILDTNDPDDQGEELEILCQEVGING
ncbi:MULTISPECIES: phage head closure protein [Bacillus]|uniref:Head-tail adaptor protein n=1 Tax=Bacillus velezensis TaxID=492670 RepID=A0ABC8D951_BACVE|nr:MULTISPECIES: phage head closure protein [Bacillus]AJC23694.1 phage head-tail adapter protein [Bacillus sp. Pc3]ANB49573.1 phage head-tail adapter protein [Bacillus velezensis]AQP98125.1 phage head-tail adapter protein [Bacillus sp. 275]AVI28702.1 head-tail adaptor protein [Bacillus velezensis]AWX72354.1 head-tail adaptor protein [Bacillus velezensis]